MTLTIEKVTLPTEQFEERFEDSPRRPYVYLDATLSPPWYYWDSDKEMRVPIKHTIYKGVLEQLSLIQRQNGQGQEQVEKLLIGFKTHAFVVGKSTIAARSFVWNLYHLIDQLPTNRLLVIPRAGDNKRVVFLKVKPADIEGEVRIPTWPQYSEADWKNFIDAAIPIVNNCLMSMSLKSFIPSPR